MFISCNIYFRSLLSFTIINTTCILLSFRRTSAPIHLTSVLGVLGTQETSCILIAALLERDIFDLYLPEFDKPWVIHLRKTCCCSTNLCTWRPNTVYKNRSVRRHHRSISFCLASALMRRRHRDRPAGQGFLPAVKPLLQHADQIEDRSMYRIDLKGWNANWGR